MKVILVLVNLVLGVVSLIYGMNHIPHPPLNFFAAGVSIATVVWLLVLFRD